MANTLRILNITRGYTLRYKQAVRAVENCAAAWVEYGVSIHDLTLAEAITARNEQATLREPLAQVELPNLRYKPASTDKLSISERIQLSRAADKFAFEATT